MAEASSLSMESHIIDDGVHQKRERQFINVDRHFEVGFME